MCDAKHFGAHDISFVRTQTNGAKRAFRKARSHTKRQTFFRNSGMLYVNKINPLRHAAADRGLAPKDGMWPWAEWMDQPTDSNLNNVGGV